MTFVKCFIKAIRQAAGTLGELLGTAGLPAAGHVAWQTKWFPSPHPPQVPGGLHSHCPFGHSQGLCRCPGQDQSRRSSLCHFLTVRCSEQPGLCECTGVGVGGGGGREVGRSLASASRVTSQPTALRCSRVYPALPASCSLGERLMDEDMKLRTPQ